MFGKHAARFEPFYHGANGLGTSMSFSEYAKDIAEHHERWGGQLEALALSVRYQVGIFVVPKRADAPVYALNPHYKRKIALWYTDDRYQPIKNTSGAKEVHKAIVAEHRDFTREVTTDGKRGGAQPLTLP